MQIDYGPLKSLLSDPEISEIMVNGPETIFVERRGQLSNVPLRFVDSRALEELIQTLLYAEGIAPGESLCFDGSLPDGSRFNATLPPMSPKGATLTIRKFNPSVMGLDALVQKKALSAKAASFLSTCVRGRISLVVSGGTGTGKTTMLNSLASAIPADERIVSIEDVAELQIRHPHWVRLLSVHRSGKGATARDCLVNALRMRPDRILVGECRRDETADMLQAMNTGHEGSMTSVHANSAIDALARIESMILTASGDIPLKALRKQMSQALDLIVHVRRDRNGLRFVSEIVEITGMEGEVITRAVLFQVPEGKTGGEELKSTGLVPGFQKRLEERGLRFAPRFFDPASSVSS